MKLRRDHHYRTSAPIEKRANTGVMSAPSQRDNNKKRVKEIQSTNKERYQLKLAAQNLISLAGTESD